MCFAPTLSLHVEHLLTSWFTAEAIHARFLFIYHHLRSIGSVAGLDIRACAIVWRVGSTNGQWGRLNVWQKLEVSFEVTLPWPSYRRIERADNQLVSPSLLTPHGSFTCKQRTKRSSTKPTLYSAV